jgi:hypothetical protein
MEAWIAWRLAEICRKFRPANERLHSPRKPVAYFASAFPEAETPAEIPAVLPLRRPLLFFSRLD